MANELDMRRRREEMRRQTHEEAESIVKLAGFEIRHTWELANGYWPDATDYDDVRQPWWLFLTDIGPVQIGRRKRVLHIQWDACSFRGVVTEDDVSKGDTYVHAWSAEKAVEYVRGLRRAALSSPPTPASSPKVAEGGDGHPVDRQRCADCGVVKSYLFTNVAPGAPRSVCGICLSQHLSAAIARAERAERDLAEARAALEKSERDAKSTIGALKLERDAYKHKLESVSVDPAPDGAKAKRGHFGPTRCTNCGKTTDAAISLWRCACGEEIHGPAIQDDCPPTPPAETKAPAGEAKGEEDDFLRERRRLLGLPAPSAPASERKETP